MNLFEIENLKRYFIVKDGFFKKAPIKAVDDISFELKKGEILSIVGESGCGKSTTAKLLIGIDNPTDGKILFKQKDRTKFRGSELKEFRKSVQIIFQDPYSSLNPRWKVGKIIAEPLELNSNLNKKEIKEEVLAIMQKVGLKQEWYERYPHQFSGGQRQRIGIARALILKPEVIICDEPVSALDVSIQAQVLNLLLDLQEEFGLTYLFISHDLGVVRHISDRILVMQLGKIVERGTTEEIFENPQHEFTKTLIEAIPKI
ncbi:ABC transporter ATP-binding protein [uncultured Campylobacter sp.]|uniref:ABC transporter ATP-binding protein n=1 Tax=uncultured Campylobacter sp. TaxID=218934 RepID=UPI002629B682|nr:ATP-binding cassette domain-containing protein [uncultured Campylobacter sp.]